MCSGRGFMFWRRRRSYHWPYDHVWLCLRHWGSCQHRRTHVSLPPFYFCSHRIPQISHVCREVRVFVAHAVISWLTGSAHTNHSNSPPYQLQVLWVQSQAFYARGVMGDASSAALPPSACLWAIGLPAYRTVEAKSHIYRNSSIVFLFAADPCHLRLKYTIDDSSSTLRIC